MGLKLISLVCIIGITRSHSIRDRLRMERMDVKGQRGGTEWLVDENNEKIII